jgi:hypothetical protein
MTLYQSATSKSNVKSHQTPQWDTKLISLTIQLLKSIWEDRNHFQYGTTRNEAAEKARALLLDKVHAIYRSPPKVSCEVIAGLS